MGNIFEKRLGGTVTPSGTVGLVVNRGHTGRSTPVGLDYRQAEEWSKVALELDALPSHPAAERFRAKLRSVSQYVGSTTFVRGRRDDGSINGWRDMGPPPRGAAQGSRYAAPGIIVLYLCDSTEGVIKELPVPAGRGLFFQDYELATSIRLADFTDPQLSEFLKAVFDMAENSMVDGRVGPIGYGFSQVVAEIVREAGFEGMIVPGVRGHKDLRYRNVVVFEPGDNWLAWSRREAGFRFSASAEGAV
jgi:hypothetical protein